MGVLTGIGPTTPTTCFTVLQSWRRKGIRAEEEDAFAREGFNNLSEIGAKAGKRIEYRCFTLSASEEEWNLMMTEYCVSPCVGSGEIAV